VAQNKHSVQKKEPVMTQDVYGPFFVLKALIRAAFAALVLGAAAAHAEPANFHAQHQGDRQGNLGNQGNQYNWLVGGGG
jgi:hypothetical protein